MQALQLSKSHYRLSDIERYCYVNKRNHLQKFSKVKKVKRSSFLYKTTGRDTIRNKGACVDDRIAGGSKKFENESKPAEIIVNFRARLHNTFIFAGIFIERIDTKYLWHQRN